MSAPTIHEPDHDLAQSTSSSGRLGFADVFADHIARWSARSGAIQTAQTAAAEGARRLIIAMDEGHVCLVDPSFTDQSVVQCLFDSGMVASHLEPGNRPMLLDTAGRLYLHRMLDHEQALARSLDALAAAPAVHATPSAAQALRERFAHVPGGTVDGQQLACASALCSQVLVLSGGPGTGKTTTVVNLLAVLLAQTPSLRIALCAPTGKAAARMVESIRARAAQLPAAVHEALPQTAATVHRLLGYQAHDRRFRHHADNPLDCDLLVVDEASMLDLALARRLVQALPPGARLILLGDKDQLASVEAGAVFSQLSQQRTLGTQQRERLAVLCGIDVSSLDMIPGGDEDTLPAHVCWLTENYRFREQAAIGALAAAVRDGQTDAALAVLADPAQEAVRRLPEPLSAAGIEDVLRTGFAEYFSLLAEGCRDARTLLAALGRFRVLCAQRQGPRGVSRLNAVARQLLARSLGPGAPDDTSAALAGEPLMLLANDYALDLFNGDVGVLLPDATGQLQGVFERSDGSLLHVPLARLTRAETAFAITVHKSQGSEFDAVLVVMPEAQGPLASRELLYTALTRARQRVLLASTDAVLRHAIDTPTLRLGGLPDRLAEAAHARRSAFKAQVARESR
jgi:exodeoxyribonuclease V alpha subunit